MFDAGHTKSINLYGSEEQGVSVSYRFLCVIKLSMGKNQDETPGKTPISSTPNEGLTSSEAAFRLSQDG